MAHPAQPSVCMCHVKVRYPQTLTTLLQRHGLPKLTTSPRVRLSLAQQHGGYHRVQLSMCVWDLNSVCHGYRERPGLEPCKACQLSHVPEAEFQF